MKIIGEGTFSFVYLSKDSSNGNKYALKIMKKNTILKLKQVPQIFNEIKILFSLKHPNIVNPYYFILFFRIAFWHDDTTLYLMTEYIQGEELFQILRKERRFTSEDAKFYITQVISFLEYIHSMNIAYRDIKPENLMVNEKGYIKVVDFGFAKKIDSKSFTFCGTPEYVSPEIITCKGHGIYTDYWSLGILIFELLTGYTPFSAVSTTTTYHNIVKCEYRIPPHVNPSAHDLIRKLLVVDTTKRLGCQHNGIQDIQLHEWFSYYKRNKFSWKTIYEQGYESPFTPDINTPMPDDTTIELDNNDIILSKQQSALFDCFDDLTNTINKHEEPTQENQNVQEEDPTIQEENQNIQEENPQLIES